MINPIKYLKNIKFKMPSREEIANLAKAAIAIIISNKETFKKIYDYLKDFLPSNDKVKKELEKLQADYKKLEALNLEQQKNNRDSKISKQTNYYNLINRYSFTCLVYFFTIKILN